MNKIKILSSDLINKISAGEVLDRPASAIKELVENSIDANSSKIEVFIRNGGKTEMKVIDNGSGISNSELTLATMRHSTSKLENLDKINTLGFRGEALSSIATVSNMKIESKSKFNELGSEIYLRAGKKDYQKPFSRINGTSITIKDIFFSTPARLKFLKSEKHETFLIKRIIQKLALSNPKIEFLFYNNDNLVFRAEKISSMNFDELLRKRVIRLLGKNFEENMITINQKTDLFTFTGLIGLPTFNHSNNSNLFVFINKRIINDKMINSVIKTAYRDYQSYDRYPQVVFFIETFSDEVDVNVHPTKNEVRFKNPSKLRSAIIGSITKTLSEVGFRSSTSNTNLAIKTIKSSNSKLNFKTFTQNDKNPLNQSFKRSEENISAQDSNQLYETLGDARCQYHENFIISQTKDGIIIVDQHAAHERIVYEKLKKNFYNNKIETQILLIPEIINFESNLLTLVTKRIKTLEKYGIFLEQFGNDSILVREIPLILASCNIKELIKDIINQLVEIGDTDLLEMHINKICSSMACHGSIRAGRKMRIEEMNKLLRDMESTPFSGQCNHGRPTYIELKLNDIEKLFGRK